MTKLDVKSGPKVIEKIFMLNSAEHENFPATVGILTFMSRINSIWACLSLKNDEFLIFFYTCEHLKFLA